MCDSKRGFSQGSVWRKKRERYCIVKTQKSTSAILFYLFSLVSGAYNKAAGKIRFGIGCGL